VQAWQAYKKRASYQALNNKQNTRNTKTVTNNNKNIQQDHVRQTQQQKISTATRSIIVEKIQQKEITGNPLFYFGGGRKVLRKVQLSNNRNYVSNKKSIWK